MNSGHQTELLTVERYLRMEATSAQRHEYVGGTIHAMGGGTNAHNLVASNLLVALATRLRPGPCRAYNSDTKIRIRLPGHTRFYYPDVSVVCQSNPADDHWQDLPVLVAEVLSAGTRRTDLSEKKEAYLALPSLSTYLMVETTTPAWVLLRRTDQGFVRELCSGLDAVCKLPELGLDLPLREVYDGLEFDAPAGPD